MYSQKTILTLMACQASISLTNGFQPTPLTSSKHHYRIDHGKNHGVSARSDLSRRMPTTLMVFDNINNLMGRKDEKPSGDDDKSNEEKSPTKKISPGQKLMEKYSKSPENLLNKALGKVDNNPSAATAAPTVEAPKVTTPPPTPPTITSASTQTDDNAPIYKEGLDSKNPLIRLKAQVEVAAAEKQRDIRIAKNKKIEQINDAKKKINDAKNVKEEEVSEEEIQEEVPSSKMKVSELKAKIKEDIISLLQEEEEEEVEVEDEVEVDVEEPAMDASDAQDGLTQDEKEIQDSLKIAYDNAVAMGDQKLADQIGNSITFFTRTHVVER